MSLPIYQILNNDCLEVLKKFDSNSIDCCITDPPYGMGMEHWDHSVPSKEIWIEVNRVLKPGAFCLSFCSPQLYHRLATNIEDAELKIQDQIMWMTTTKMPKFNRLKPAHEPIVVAQKKIEGTIENNYNKYGIGKINIEDCRIPWDKKPPTGWVADGVKRRKFGKNSDTKGGRDQFGTVDANPNGRYPSNIIGEVLPEHQKYFYSPRVSSKERMDFNDHPTPKPIELMEYLIKLYCPEDKTVLDPFCGSGSTGIAALKNNRKFIGIEKESKYCEITQKRIDLFFKE